MMNDLTTGSIPRHLIHTAVPIAAGMLFQTLYYLVDLYFIGQLGDAPLAGVSSAGVVMFLFMALTQVLTVGTVALISHAVGRKDQVQATLLFNQSLSISAVLFAATLIIGGLLAESFVHLVAADAVSAAYGRTYLYWYLPGLALQFGLVSMGGALRGTGVVKPTMIIQSVSVAVNIILSPLLITGWGTGLAMGVAGAALASSLSVLVGVVLLLRYFARTPRYIRVDRAQWWPRLSVWRQMLRVGVPSGAEFLLMFVLMAVCYMAIADFGVDAQAGFGIGTRIMQFFFLPGMAVAFALAPLVGQNTGAGLGRRVVESFRLGLALTVVIMLLLALVCVWQVRPISAWFSDDPAVIEYSVIYMTIIAWNFVPTGVIFTCSGLFQGLGNTIPSLISSTVRLMLFVGPALWMMDQDWFAYAHLWQLSVVTVMIQALVSLVLARTQVKPIRV